MPRQRFEDEESLRAVYEGRRLVGWIKPTDGGHYVAIGCDHRQINGRFPSLSAAIGALPKAKKRRRDRA
jgi:hypothetical protein